MPETPIKNDLQARLSKLDLTYSDVPRLCPPGMPLSIQTVRDLATGRRFGDRRSWERIRAALNAHLKSNAYDVEDLIGDNYDEYLPPLVWNGSEETTSRRWLVRRKCGTGAGSSGQAKSPPIGGPLAWSGKSFH